MSKFRKTVPQANLHDFSEVSVPKALLQQATKTGQLNLSGRDFRIVPKQVWKLYCRQDEDVKFDSTETDRWWDQAELKKLILASNNLTTLSYEIATFPTLVVLDLHDNKLLDLPEEIGQLEVLEKLDVSHNELSKLPDGLTSLSKLSTLLLQHNALVSLPYSFGQLESLSFLDCSNNKLKFLPDDWSQFKSLQRLNLSSNQLSRLPPSLCRSPLLNFIDFSTNKLSELPQDWTSLTSLRELYLRNNCLEYLPDLRACTSLKEIYCSGNAFVKIQIDHMPASVIVAELRDNKITEVPEHITSLQNLQRFDISNNDISTLPPILGSMEQIKVLNVDGNPMRTIRRDIIDKGTMAIMKYLRTRIMNNQATINQQEGFSSLPVSSTVARYTKLHTLTVSKLLDLSKKQFSADLLSNCSGIALESINLSRTCLSQLPNELLQFQDSLRTLECSFNQISMIDSFIGNFMYLSHLDLATNALTSLPSELSNLQNLIELNIMQNRFKSIPACVYDLLSLEHLLASGNQIEHIDATALKRLTKLSTLSLQNNSISQVPPELGLISTLRNLQLEGNTFRIPRQNILQQGTVAVMEYLKGRVPNK